MEAGGYDAALLPRVVAGEEEEGGFDPLLARKNVRRMGIGFFLLFSAFNTVQATASTNLAGFTGDITGKTYNLGTASLFALYLVVTPSVYFAPAVCRRLGEVRTMAMGAGGYVVFMAVLVQPEEAAIWLGSAITGVSGALLWVANGALLTRFSDPARRGDDVGIFWSIFQCSGVAGPLAGKFIEDWSLSAFYVAASISALLGCLVLASTDSPPPARKAAAAAASSARAGEGKEAPGAVALLHSTDSVAMFRMGPMLFLTGFELAFVNSVFPAMFAPADAQADTVLFVFIGFGCAEIMGAYATSRVSTAQVGRKTLLVVGALLYLCGIAAALAVSAQAGAGPSPLLPSGAAGVSYLAYVGGALFGFADCLFNTQVYALLGELFGNDESAEAFKVFQFLQNVGGAIGFVLPLLVTSSDMLAYVNVAVAVVCTASAVTVPLGPPH